jgi:hypothetical protein
VVKAGGRETDFIETERKTSGSDLLLDAFQIA